MRLDRDYSRRMLYSWPLNHMKKKTHFQNKVVTTTTKHNGTRVCRCTFLPLKSTATMITDLILITLAPALILFSLPLTIFAAVTTTLAISTLFLRALIAYVELAAFLARNQVALISSQLISHTRSSSPSAFTTSSSAEDPPIISSNGLDRSDSRKLKLSHRTSIASNGPLTPRPFGESNMSGSGGGGIYGRNSAGVFGQRDFEGVGGWGMEDSDDEDRVPWTVMSSRLELPNHVAHERRDGIHPRSGSSMSFMPTRPTSWHALTPSSRRPTSWHAKTPSGSTCSNSGGDYFSTKRSSRPTSWHAKTPSGSTCSNSVGDYFSPKRSSRPTSWHAKTSSGPNCGDSGGDYFSTKRT